MTRKTEQRLWDRMRTNAAKSGHFMRMMRVENLVGVGMPDVLVIRNGLVTWCELKSVDAPPARSTTRVLGARGLSVAQRNWHYDWYMHGGYSIILVGVGPTAIFAIPGKLAAEVNEMTSTELLRRCVASNWYALFKSFGEIT